MPPEEVLPDPAALAAMASSYGIEIRVRPQHRDSLRPRQGWTTQWPTIIRPEVSPARVAMVPEDGPRLIGLSWLVFCRGAVFAVDGKTCPR